MRNNFKMTYHLDTVGVSNPGKKSMTMLKKDFIFITIILAMLLVGSCATNSEKQDQALQVLQGFFEKLAQNEYDMAAAQYAGSYEILVSFNPDLDPDDHAALWQSGCQLNGLKCLTVRSATFTKVNEAGEYVFIVEFNAPDGSLFKLGSCCGEEPPTQPQSQFTYRVVEDGDGHFGVLDMPVYMP